jgi:hypothetical protein
MQIEDAGEVTQYETMTTERTLYLSAIRSISHWYGGPSSYDKAEVERLLSQWSGCDAARIYAVKVPVQSKPAA